MEKQQHHDVGITEAEALESGGGSFEAATTVNGTDDTQEALDKARRDIRVAGVTGLVAASVGLVVMLAALRGYGSTRVVEYFADPFLLFDVAILVGLSIWVLRKSRLGACLLFTYFAASKIIMFAQFGAGSILITVIMLVLFGRGIRGTFNYRKLNPSPSGEIGIWKVLGILVGGVVALVFLLIISFAFAMQFGYIPDSKVVEGDELRPSTVQLLREHGVLQEHEKIHYFYSTALFSFLEDGNFFTGDRVVSYSDLEGDSYLASARFEDIAHVDIQQAKSSLEDTIISIYPEQGGEFILFVSSEKKKDKLFYERLKDVWQAKRTSPEEPEEERP